VQVDVPAEQGPLVARRGAGEHLPHVAGACQAGQAGAVFQGVGEFAWRHVRVLLEPEHEPRVDGTGPGRHHQAVERGEPHGGVDGTAAVHGRERGAGAEMAGHDTQSGRRGRRSVPGELRRPAGDVGVRQPVEAVPAQRPAGPPLGGKGERRRRRGDRRVERGVEAGHRGHVGQHRAHGVERGERLGLVQRREVGQRLEPLAHLCGEHYGRRVQRPAVHHPVAHRVDRAERLDGRLDRRAARGVVKSAAVAGPGHGGQVGGGGGQGATQPT
jgi:hypothetical protein